MTPDDFQALYRSVGLLFPKLAERGRRFLLKSSTLYMRNTLALAHSHWRRAAARTPAVADTTLQIAHRPITKPGKDRREEAGSRMRFQPSLCQHCIDHSHAVTQEREGREPAKSPHRPIPFLHWTLPLLPPTQTHKSKYPDTHLNMSTRARTRHAHAVYKHCAAGAAGTESTDSRVSGWKHERTCPHFASSSPTFTSSRWRTSDGRGRAKVGSITDLMSARPW